MLGRKVSLSEGVGGSGVGGLLNLLGVALVELHELGKIELGLLEHLDLLDEDVLEWEDLRAILGDLLDDGVGKAKMIYYLLTNLTLEGIKHDTYKFLKRSLRDDFWHSLTIISIIF